MRITHQSIKVRFQYYCEVFGFRMATSWNDVGGYRLDYTPEYGGWRIEKIVNIEGGVMDIMNERYSNKDFYNLLRFAIKSYQEKKYNEQGV